MDNTETINILSLCTGYGGLELGLAGALEGVFRVVAVEVEAYALANLAAKVQEGKLAIEAMWPDLKTFPAERFRGCFDFILAGYPCQPFSVAGKRKGTDDPRHLWPHIAGIVQAVRPVWCFFENVPGHLTIGFGEVYCKLRDMGYAVEAGLFSAAECGAPHRRQRLFCLAHDTACRFEDGKIQQKRKPALRHGGGGLAGTERPEQGQGTIKETSAAIGGNRPAECDLADGDSTGCTQQDRAEPVREKQLSIEYGRWPSRPGQPQYEWEEPRVVDNACGGISRPGRTGWARKSIDKGLKVQHKQAQSRLGGAAYESSRRVDRLRLLGNGVVPMQAEKAFRYLIRMFEK